MLRNLQVDTTTLASIIFTNKQMTALRGGSSEGGGDGDDGDHG